MNRVFPYLFGPELYWIIICVLMPKLTRRNQAPDPAVTDMLDRYWAVLPLVVVPLTFAFFLLPGVGRWWLLLRIDLAIAIGLVVATTTFCQAMTHHQPSSGPGAGTAYMVMIIFGYCLLLLGTVVAALTIWWRGRVAG